MCSPASIHLFLSHSRYLLTSWEWATIPAAASMETLLPG